MFQVNQYFDGKVASIAFAQPEGSATANSRFNVKIERDTAYLCEYR